MSSSISLTINDGDGLSYAIDRALDKEFGKDITLGKLRQWNTIFDYIKQDQAEQTQENQKQFSEQDNDITNNSQYQVNSGLYNITQAAWTKIVAFVKQEIDLGKVDVKELQNPEQEEVAEKKDTQSSSDSTKKTVLGILEKAKINTEGLDIDDICKKYDSIYEYNQSNGISNDNINERIENYARGRSIYNKENKFAQLWEKNVQSSDEKIEDSRLLAAVQAKDTQGQIDAYHQMAKEYIEVYGNVKGNGKIQMFELISREVSEKEKELGRKLTDKEKKEIKDESIRFLTTIDQDGNKLLDENEIAGYLWALSNINGDKTYSDITYEEWKKGQESIVLFSLSEKDMTYEQKLQFGTFSQTIKNGYNGLKK